MLLDRRPQLLAFAFFFALAYAEKMLWGRCHSEALATDEADYRAAPHLAGEAFL